MNIYSSNQYVAGISEAKDGQMILSRGDIAVKNRARYFEQVGVDPARVVSCNLVHGDCVTVVGEKECGTSIHDCDALVTTEKNVALAVTVSDCTPLYFYDEVAGIIGVAHAGWRGVVKRIAVRVVEAMVAQGASVENIRIIIGPHIRACHFEIKEDVLPEFAQYPDAVIKKDIKLFVDTAQILKLQLTAVGVTDEHIEDVNICTYCDTRFYSYRRAGSAEVTSQVAWIMRNHR